MELADRNFDMQDQRKLGISLRNKLLFLLTSLPLITLTLYLLMAADLFEEDKKAYARDSAVTVSQSLAKQIRLEVESFLGLIKPVLTNYDRNRGVYTQGAMELFTAQSKVDALVIYKINKANQFIKQGEFSRPSGKERSFLVDTVTQKQIREQTHKTGLTVQSLYYAPSHLAIGYRISSSEEDSNLILVGLYRATDLLESFEKSLLYRSFLVDSNGIIFMRPDGVEESHLKGIAKAGFFKPILTKQQPQGSEEISTIDGVETIVSYSQVGTGGLIVTSVVDKEKALQAVDMLMGKSITFFVALFMATVIISIFASTTLTSTLRELFEATNRIAQGSFDVRVRSRSNDEVGGLANSFNYMAGEISRLMTETAEKARMENELATVKTVQETLFPESSSSFGPFNIVGHFEPASECGGDWWSYSQVDDKVYLWIGDATGHGAPAALITSAARSAAAIVESLPDMSPSRALEIMNNAVYQTSKGQIMMTFFLGCLDLKSGVLRYANASHDPPYLVRMPADRNLKKKDLQPLMDVVGPRLGDQPSSKYEEHEVHLQKGDTILFYTDGVIDLINEQGEVWGERNFIKSVISCMTQGQTIDQKMDTLRSSISDYRKGSDLVDDVTLFMCHYEEAA